MNGRDLGLLFGGFIIGVATGLMFKKKEEPTKEELVKEFNEELEIQDSDTPRNTYWTRLSSEIKEKIAKDTENGNKPYSKENPPSPMTEEQMRAYTKLKLMKSYMLLSSEEACALQELTKYEELLNKYSKEK
jgi:hypothetical protein